MSRRITTRVRVRVTAALALATSLEACAGPPQQKAAVRGDSPATDATPALWAQRVGDPVPMKRARSVADRRIEPAALGDSEYATRELIPARRIVYRVNVAVPAALQPQRPIIMPPAGELHIDVSEQRLRARFVGPGWPIDEGSEVRLRGDVPGVYLFDAQAGRPVPPGQLSSWFQGGARGRIELGIQDYNASPTEGQGDLFCALLAEWTHNPRDEVLRRCAGTLPPTFRFGVFIADLTAFVPVQIPRADLRADTQDPPPPQERARTHQLIEPDDLARIAPIPVRAGDPQPAANSGKGLTTAASGLSVDNRMSTRVVVVVQGIAIGFVDAGSRATFVGLSPGNYRVAAMRTSSPLTKAALVVAVPGELRVAGPEGDQLGSEPLLSSPEAAR